MKVPNADSAFVDMNKLVNYTLSSTHPYGQHKAHVFKAALGLTQHDAPLLRDALLSAVMHEEGQLGKQDEFGQRYIVEFVMQTWQGEATIRSAWIIRHDENFPRYVTAYVIR